MKRTLLALSILALAGCTTLDFHALDRQSGALARGTATGNFTGTGGDMSIAINGKTFTGKWAGIRNMGFIGGSVGSTPLLLAASGGGASTGSAILSAPDGDYLRCEFRYSEWSYTGQGVCQGRGGRLYDIQTD